MSNTDFGPITALGDVLNTGGNLLGSTWGIASFSTPDQVNGNFVFYVAGQEGISVHHLLHSGTVLEVAQSVVDTPESLMSGLSNIEIFTQGGKTWLIGAAYNDAALNVFEVNADTGLLTFVRAVSEGLTLASTESLAQLRIGNQSFVVTFNRFSDNLAIWQLSDSGVLTQVDLVSGAIHPLAGVGVVASLHLDGQTTNRDGFITASMEGLTLWQVDGTGAVAQLDNIAVNGVTSLDIGSYRDGEYLLAGDGSTRSVKVVEVGTDNQLTLVSTYNLQDAGFFGDVTTVKSFSVDGIRLIVVVTSVGEILLMGMQEGGTLQLADTGEWVNDPTCPVRNANDVEMVFTDGQAVLAIAGTQPQTESSLEGVTLFTIGGGDDVLTGSAADDDMLGFDDQDSLSGLGVADRLYGGKGLDTIQGGSGTDSIGGGLGDDLLNGGTGIDEIFGDQGADTMDGGSGRDTLSYDAANGKVNINLATNIATGKGAAGDVIANFERVSGSCFADTLTGDDLDNGLFGGDGNDRLNGGADNDTLNGLSGDDTVNGDAGDDVLSGSGGLNLLFGGDGNDKVRFGSGDD